MTLGTFELEVLGCVADDYEAMRTIRNDLARSLGRSVSEAEVGSALLGLSRAGLVDAFLFDSSSFQYRRVDVAECSDGACWFLISEEGRSRYEREGKPWFERTLRGMSPTGRILSVHLAASSVALVVGELDVGGPLNAVAYCAALTFFLINLPGVVVLKLLPFDVYAYLEPVYVRVARLALLVAITQVILFVVCQGVRLLWRMVHPRSPNRDGNLGVYYDS